MLICCLLCINNYLRQVEELGMITYNLVDRAVIFLIQKWLNDYSTKWENLNVSSTLTFELTCRLTVAAWAYHIVKK